MTEYGHMIDSDLIEDKRTVHDMFTSYFGNPSLTKIKDDNNCSVYAAKVNLQLREYRYLLITCEKDNFTIGTNFKLEDLRWISLQTRSLKYELPCDVFTYLPNKKYPFTSRLFLKERGEKNDHLYFTRLQDLSLFVTYGKYQVSISEFNHDSCCT